MPIDTGYLPPLPAEQQRLREKCCHHGGRSSPFRKEALAGSILERFAQMAVISRAWRSRARA